MTGAEGRRPLKSRDRKWARSATAFLASKGARPNRISQAGVGFAAVGLLAFLGMPLIGPDLHAIPLVIAAFAMQARLVCNLLDGMVAVEGGLKEADGPFWNEVPDRVSDAAFLVGAGFAAGIVSLGWVATALAVLTAYLRELGRAEGQAPDYRGPMAKQHRMALLTVACLVAAVWPEPERVLSATLWLITLGTAATALRRSLRLIRGLKAR